MDKGRSLSLEDQRKLIKTTIKAGLIIHIFCNIIKNPKNKFIVIIHVDFEEDLLLVFIINSKIS